MDKIEKIGEKEVYDVPVLHKEALVVLEGICRYVYDKISKTNSIDFVENRKDLKGTKIIVTSALRINSNYKEIGSGFSFCLQGTGMLGKGVLYEQIMEYHKYVDDLLNRKKSKIADIPETAQRIPCFDVALLPGKANEVRVTVRATVVDAPNKKTEPEK